MFSIQIVYDEGVRPLPPAREELLQTRSERILNHLADCKGSVGILFCDGKRIRELNRAFRQKNEPTDILSWSCLDSDAPDVASADTPWGELAICLEVCRKQAERSGWELETELQRLIVHGIVHLLGYDHQTPEEEREMLRLETDLLSRIGLRHLY